MRSRALLCLVAALLGARGSRPLEAQDPPPTPPPPPVTAPAPAPAPAQAPAPAPPDAVRPLGPSLFPLYDHYLRTADDTEVRTVFFFYHSTQRRNRLDGSRLLLPLYYWQRREEPPDRRLYLFPLLFFHRSSDEESFNYALPAFFDRRTPKRSFQLLFPLWWHQADHDARSSVHRLLFPLLRVTSLGAGGERPGEERRVRFGLRFLLELFESRVGPAMRRLAGLNFFNFSAETRGGLALFRSERSRTQDGAEEARDFLFPLYYRHALGGEADALVAGPFYGHFAGGGRVTRFVTPLIWWAAGEGDMKALLLAPFYHRATRKEPSLSLIASYPFFHHVETARERRLSLLLGLYRQVRHLDTGKVARAILFPLGYFDVEPDGSKAHRHFLPFYYDRFDSARRFRFSFPFWWNYQTRAGGEWATDFTLILPTYVGWGAPRDYFATGFPLYWSSRSGPRGWDLLIPLLWRETSATTSSFYSLPFTRVRFPSQRAISILAGGATHRRFYDAQGAPEGWALDLAWWLFGAKRTARSGGLRVLPLFAWSRDGEDTSLLLFPFLYRQSSPRQSQNYFFPAYGKFETSDGRLRREYYALASYARTEEREEAGAPPFRRRHDVLWSLLSFQNDEKIRETHRRILPLGFWQTRGVPEDRTVLGPFYYSHRVEHHDERHRLSLFLGNFFLSKTVERHGPLNPPPAGAGPAAAGAGSPGAESLVPLSRERGVLWPLARWGHDAEGNPSEWVLPFYHHSRYPTEESHSLFPLAHLRRFQGPYQTRYFRYFFLFDRERFEDGLRVSVGQLLFDWFKDDVKSERRFRILYPIVEGRWSPEGYGYQFTPLCQGERRESGGERRSSHFLFPFYFRGATELRRADGTYTADARHFYLFPLFGVSKKSLREEREFLIPIFHYRRSLDGFAFQARPVFFLRREPEGFSLRLWPLHSQESGEGSGEWWVSRFLYLSKLAVRRLGYKYRLDPFLTHIHTGRSPQDSALPALVDYRTTLTEGGLEVAWHALPLAYGYSRAGEAGAGLIPLSYARDFGEKEIDHATPWRFIYVLNRLRGAGKRHWSLLWKLAEYTDQPARPAFHEFRVLQALLVHRTSETDRRITVGPLFDYHRDDAEKRLDLSLLFYLYRFRSVEGLPRHWLFWGAIRW